MKKMVGRSLWAVLMAVMPEQRYQKDSCRYLPILAQSAFLPPVKSANGDFAQ